MRCLHPVWNSWKRLGRFVGDFVGRVVLTLFYFTLLVPFAAILRWIADPLRLDSSQRSSFWIDRDTCDPVLEDARRQF